MIASKIYDELWRVAPINLAEILLRRDERQFELQKLLLEGKNLVVCLALNIPGPVKNSASLKRFFNAESTALQTELMNSGHGLEFSSRLELKTGPEAYMSIEPVDNFEKIEQLKKKLIAFEEAKAWRRLLDIDLVYNGKYLGREVYGLEPRSCLICARAARDCARSRRHELTDLLLEIAKLIAMSGIGD
ncbi:MAG: citrate lyase holo-[acyl-carrier protein] synthase [Eubacteriales bacterium]|nr:citrate lyase holo-[acyl-carrier protein] synthase [Eubacteriales bacterium]